MIGAGATAYAVGIAHGRFQAAVQSGCTKEDIQTERTRYELARRVFRTVVRRHARCGRDVADAMVEEMGFPRDPAVPVPDLH